MSEVKIMAAKAKKVIDGEVVTNTQDALRISGELSISGIAYGDIAFTKPDTTTIRKIYHNMQTDRLLGSFVAAPIVNLLAGYIGLPEVRLVVTNAPDTSATLEQILKDNEGALSQIHRLALRDGRAFLQINFNEIKSALYSDAENQFGRFTIRTILSDQIVVGRNFVTGEIDYAEISDSISWLTETSEERRGILKTIITPKIIKYERGDNSFDMPSDIIPKSKPNRWGFVPIIEFVNEPEAFGSYGVSEIERVEPLIRLYHDVMLAAAKGSKMHSTPKLGFYLEDTKRFIKDNFPETTAQLRSGERPTISMVGRELFTLGKDDKAEYIEADNPIGSASNLLKLIFYCMVITSETPEFSLGVHMPSSYASTVEQTPIWILKVQRKQKQFTSSWQTAGRMLLAMISKSTGKNIESYAVEVNWSLPDGADKASVALHQLNTVQSVLLAVDGKIMSYKTAIETLRKVFPDMEAIEGGNGQRGELAEIYETAKMRQELGAEDSTDSIVAKVKPDNRMKSDTGSEVSGKDTQKN